MLNYRQLKLVDCPRSNKKLKELKVRSINQRISLTIIPSLENVTQNMDDEAPTKIKFECESMQESDLFLPDQTGINEKEEF